MPRYYVGTPSNVKCRAISEIARWQRDLYTNDAIPISIKEFKRLETFAPWVITFFFCHVEYQKISAGQVKCRTKC